MPKWVFVWTAGDVFALIFIGLLVLLGFVIGALVLWEKIQRAWWLWRHKRGERVPRG